MKVKQHREEISMDKKPIDDVVAEFFNCSESFLATELLKMYFDTTDDSVKIKILEQLQKIGQC